MPLLSVANAATAFRRPPGTIRRWIHEDRIPGQFDPELIGHRGRRMVYPSDKLQEAYERRTSAAH